MRRQYLCLTLLLAACEQFQIAHTEMGLTGGGEFSAESFGAEPDDGIDDRSGLQAAIDAACDAGGGVVRLRAGLYEVSPNPQAGATNVDSIAIRCSHVRLTGEGLSTVVQATGDSLGRDWNLIQIRSTPVDPVPVRNIEIDNMLLSGVGAWNTPEQTHLVQVGVGPVESVSLHHLWFHHPVRQKQDLSGPEKGGDCIRLLGGPDKAVRFIQITDSQFLDCDRSGVSFQREVYDTIIDSNIFLAVGDQHVDQEPSGDGALGRTVVSSNLFMGGAQGAYAVTLTGNAIGQPSSEMVFARNVVFGRGLSLINVQRAVVSDNVIMSHIDTADAVIHARKATEDLVLRGNRVERMSGSAPGPVVAGVPYSSGFPGKWRVDGNRFVSKVDGYGLSLESMSDVSISNNDFEFHGPTVDTFAAIRLVASQAPVDNTLVVGNHAYGNFGAMVQLSPMSHSIGAVSIVGNMTHGAPLGVLCKGGGSFTRPIVHSGNYYDGAAQATSCPDALSLVAQVP
jgi:hypothetical protein